MELCTETEARAFRAAAAAYVKRISRMTRAQLFELERADQAAQGCTHVYGGPHSKDELIGSLMELHYPVARMNMTTHVLYHRGVQWDACEWCAGVTAGVRDA